ncbi:MAG: DUF397 domain-containing protein [Nitrospirae bacterium]|nr:DUF397 domain-containing protein [Nitrospirota bacterium]MCL5062852.1 DUF397 domain-containing protein [Nitrospirota bacterium]MDA8340356.1 DUF397 domain-containing protein [Nitrospiraceae bacterium]
MNTKIVTRIVNGNVEKFKKSSFSGDYGKHCLGVCLKESSVYVINTNDSNGHVLTFTAEEWDAFLKGVKNGEFDMKRRR